MCFSTEATIGLALFIFRSMVSPVAAVEPPPPVPHVAPKKEVAPLAAPIARLEGCAGTVACFNADGSLLLTAGLHEARVWDVKTFKPIGEPVKFEPEIFSSQFVADGTDELTEGGQTLRPCLLREQVLPVGVEHDRQLQVEHLSQREACRVKGRGLLEKLIVDDLVHFPPNDVHGAEHVVLGQGNPDMHPPDAAAGLEVVLVPGATQQPVHPGDQRHLQAPDDALPTHERFPGALVLQDAVVEGRGDRLKVWFRQRVKGAQRRLVLRAEAYVPLELFQQGFCHSPGV